MSARAKPTPQLTEDQIENSRVLLVQQRSFKNDHKRTFASIFSSKLFGSAKTNGFPTDIQGIMFYKTHADTVTIKDTRKAAHYASPKLGHSFVLTDDQIERILAIANENCKPEDIMNSGLTNRLSHDQQ